jgi:hypothetical protein
MNRRTFLKAAGGALAFPWIAPSWAVAPSERITLGVIGIGPRCQYDLGCFLEEADLQCLAICDVQASRRELGKKMVDGKHGNTDCTTIRDFRELLARSDIDAVLIATGDHWHALASIMAAKAGKDVYSEKPCGITMADCQALAGTMQRYTRVFQAGTQRRSISNFQIAVQLVRSGKLGKLRKLHASVYDPLVRHEWLPAEPEPPREELDWDMWLGPSPWRPFNRRYFVGRGWQGFDDFTAGANLMDWGAHTVDICQWANAADDTTPIEYEPTHDKIITRYANGVILELNYGRRIPQQGKADLGTCSVRFECDEGWVETGDSGELDAYPASLKREMRNWNKQVGGINPGSHTRNFLDCIKSRAPTAANENIMLHSHLACFAAAIAWQLNRKLIFDPVAEAFVRDDEANRLRSSAMREPWRV